MSYPEFREELFKILKHQMSDDIEMKPVEVEKNNGCVRYGITFIKKEGFFSPTIYLEPFYNSFQKGTSIEALADELYKCYKEEVIEVPDCIKKMESFDSAKPLLYIKMIHRKENQQLLKDTPHIRFLDFALVVYFEVESEQFYKGTVLIKKYHTEAWNISEKELLEWAAANTKNKGIWFRKLSEVIEPVVPEEDMSVLEDTGSNMYVLTNQDKYFGAVSIYYPEVLNMIYEQLKEEFYLLPASIHEWVIVPVSQVRGQQELFSMVRDINDYEVSQEEILSYNIYHYSISSQKIYILKDIK